VIVLLPLGRLAEARAQIERGLQLSPLSLPIAEAVGRVSYYQRDYDRALREWGKLLEMEPRYSPARWRLGQALLAKGQPEEALRVFDEATDPGAQPPQKGRALMAYAHAAAGRKEEARRLLAELEADQETRYVPPPLIALVHVALGDRDQAFSWFERSCRERSEWIHLAKVEPLLDPIRADPRFGSLLGCVGLDR